MAAKPERPLGAGVVIRFTSTFNEPRRCKRVNGPLYSFHHYVRLSGRNKDLEVSSVSKGKILVVSQSSMVFSSSSSCGVRGSFRLASLTDRSEIIRWPRDGLSTCTSVHSGCCQETVPDILQSQDQLVDFTVSSFSGISNISQNTAETAWHKWAMQMTSM